MHVQQLNAAQVQYTFDTPEVLHIDSTEILLLSFTVTTMHERTIISATYTHFSDDSIRTVGSILDDTTRLTRIEKNILLQCHDKHVSHNRQNIEAQQNVVLMKPRVLRQRGSGGSWYWSCMFCNVSGIGRSRVIAQRIRDDHLATFHKKVV